MEEEERRGKKERRDRKEKKKEGKGKKVKKDTNNAVDQSPSGEVQLETVSSSEQLDDTPDLHIKFEEKRTDGKVIERSISPPPEKFLRLSDFKDKALDPNAESWKKLGKPVQDFYLSQNREIEGFQEVETLLGGAPPEVTPEQHKRNEMLVIYISLFANILLIISLILAVAFSGAIAIVASLVDSALDLFSSFIILFTSRAKSKVNRYKYPQGKERIEPVGILIFSAVMGTASLLLIIEAIQRLASDPNTPPDVGWITIGFLIADVTIKFCLFLFCRHYSKRSASAKALAQDHRNDVVLNTVALITAYLGSKYWAPLDPIGAIVIALWTMYNWGDSCLEQVRFLTGRAASPEFLKRLTWICFNHDSVIIGIDTVRAFHFGLRYLVEVDIVLPPDTPLRIAHDIGEGLQKKIETLEEVERAFVHLDFETSHDPNSEHKQWGD